MKFGTAVLQAAAIITCLAGDVVAKKQESKNEGGVDLKKEDKAYWSRFLEDYGPSMPTPAPTPPKMCLVDVSDRKTVKTMTRHRSPAPP
jgi:hypothetical protein